MRSPMRMTLTFKAVAAGSTAWAQGACSACVAFLPYMRMYIFLCTYPATPFLHENSLKCALHPVSGRSPVSVNLDDSSYNRFRAGQTP